MVSITAGSAKQFDIGRVIERTVGVVGANFATFIPLVLLFTAVPMAVMLWVNQKMVGGVAVLGEPVTGVAYALLFGALLVYFVCTYVLQAAIVHGSIVDLNGKRASLSDCLGTGVRMFLPLIGLALLMTFALAAGVILLIVPAMMMATAWTVAAPALVVERVGVIGAFKRSAQLTKGHRWSIFVLILACAVFGFIISLVFGIGLTLVLSMAKVTPDTAILVIKPLSSAVSAMFGAAGVAATYYELRTAKEGVGASELAAVFD